MTTKSPQYAAVLQNLEELQTTLQDTDGAEDDLLTKFQTKEWLNRRAKTKANKLIQKALSEIESNTENYEIFVDMLNGITGLAGVVRKITGICPVRNVEGRCGIREDQGVKEDGPDTSGSAAALTVNKTDHKPKYKMECFTDWMTLIDDGDGDELWIKCNSARWPKGEKLKVFFMNKKDLNWKNEDDESIQTRDVLEIANEWHQCGIDVGEDVVPKFIQCKNDEKSDIRVWFTETGNPRSKVGTVAQRVTGDKPTMWLNLAPFDNNPLRYRRTILHEFGHALGLKHEHQHPDAQLINESELYKFIADKNKTMKREDIVAKCQRQWLKQGEACQKGSYDKDSIMHYLIPVEVRATDYEGPTDLPMTLSAEDKRCIVKFYSGEEVQEEHIERRKKTDHTRMDEGTIRDEGIGESGAQAPEGASSTGPPTLQQLKKLKVPERVGANYSDFGTYLLEDNYGQKVATLETKHLRNPIPIIEDILREWLLGKIRKRPVKWEVLIKVLEECELYVLADDIKKALKTHL